MGVGLGSVEIHILFRLGRVEGYVAGMYPQGRHTEQLIRGAAVPPSKPTPNPDPDPDPNPSAKGRHSTPHTLECTHKQMVGLRLGVGVRLGPGLEEVFVFEARGRVGGRHAPLAMWATATANPSLDIRP